MDFLTEVKAEAHKAQHEHFKAKLTDEVALALLDFLNSRPDPGHEGYGQMLVALIVGAMHLFGSDTEVTGEYLIWCLTKYYDVIEPDPMLGWGTGRGSSARAMLQAVNAKVGYSKDKDSDKERIRVLFQRVNDGLRAQAEVKKVTVMGVTDGPAFIAAMRDAGFPLQRESNQEYIFNLARGVQDKAAFLGALPQDMPSIVVTYEDDDTAWLSPDTPKKRPSSKVPDAPARPEPEVLKKRKVEEQSQ